MESFEDLLWNALKKNLLTVHQEQSSQRLRTLENLPLAKKAPLISCMWVCMGALGVGIEENGRLNQVKFVAIGSSSYHAAQK